MYFKLRVVSFEVTFVDISKHFFFNSSVVIEYIAEMSEHSIENYILCTMDYNDFLIKKLVRPDGVSIRSTMWNAHLNNAYSNARLKDPSYSFWGINLQQGNPVRLTKECLSRYKCGTETLCEIPGNDHSIGTEPQPTSSPSMPPFHRRN